MITFLLLFGMQLILGKVGYLIAGMIPYQQIDTFDSFARISIHHAVQLFIGMSIILVLSKWLKLDFYFQLGDKKKGMKSLTIFTVSFIVISVIQHSLMAMNNQLPVYAFPLDTRNVLGNLGFQLILSGPTEEIVYRALPIILLSSAFGRSIKIKGWFTLEVMLSSVLFAFAHIKWSLAPLTFEASYFQIMYSFVLGTIQGIVYQRSRSILYPVLMHSFSNVLMVGGGYLFTAWLS
jgi:membrane protease YdiL (CAAX protease family)